MLAGTRVPRTTGSPLITVGSRTISALTVRDAITASNISTEFNIAEREIMSKNDGEIFIISGVEYTLDRDPRESDQEYEWRKKLFEDLQKSGGRIVIGAEDLTDHEIEQIRKQVSDLTDD